MVVEIDPYSERSGVWCDPVRNQFGENGCDYDLQTEHGQATERISLDCSGDENRYRHCNPAMATG
ncbi:hypothetical protein [Paraburkholderia sediminicola]|uniref:hypothetical protein n=1 Tax=Paraburkholderia sediminicola TaxID=458836 RepID=UPI0038BDEB74